MKAHVHDGVLHLQLLALAIRVHAPQHLVDVDADLKSMIEKLSSYVDHQRRVQVDMQSVHAGQDQPQHVEELRLGLHERGETVAADAGKCGELFA